MAKSKTIGLSLLSEYLTASPSRRKSIIGDASDPKPFIVKTYNAASSAISDDIVKGSCDGIAVKNALAQLEARLAVPMEEWKLSHLKLGIEALKKYQESKSDLKLSSWQVADAKLGPGKLVTGGMTINVFPEAILKRFENNIIQIGGLKFYFPKSRKLSKDRAEWMGAILDWYCEKHLSKAGVADYRCSMVIDLPGGAVYTAPKAKIRRRQDIEAACEEIAERMP